jgi:hypothetical protein
MMDLHSAMKPGKLLCCLPLLTALLAACNNPAEPDPEPTPPGTVAAWFNGLACTVDLYFPESDSLVTGAYLTGAVPSDILSHEDGRIAVLSSFDASIQVFDIDMTGGDQFTISLPAGSNPYSMAWNGEDLWITLLNTGQVARTRPMAGASVDVYDLGGNPTSIAAVGDVVLVGHGTWPDTTVTGGISILDASTGERVDSIATPDNVTSMRYFPESGMVHAVTTTYTGDGMISIIDPVSLQILSQVATGGAPGAPVMAGSVFASGDGFFSDDIFVYDGTGSLLSTWSTGVSPVGLAVSGDTMYISDFGADRVYLADWTTRTMLDTLATGDGPQGIVVVDR